MAFYTYKDVVSKIPQRIVDEMGDSFDNDANYNGDWWTATSIYIDELEEEIARLKSGKFTIFEIADFPFPIKMRNEILKQITKPE